MMKGNFTRCLVTMVHIDMHVVFCMVVYFLSVSSTNSTAGCRRLFLKIIASFVTVLHKMSDKTALLTNHTPLRIYLSMLSTYSLVLRRRSARRILVCFGAV